MKKVKILIVDDHHIFRTGIISLLEKDENLEIMGEAENGLEAIDIIKQNQPDIIFLDLEMPIKNGYDVLDFLKKKYKNIKVIIISMLDDINDISRSMRAGANAFISKSNSEKDLIDAINLVMNGETFICQKSIKVLADHKTESKLVSDLTKREIELIQFIAMGFSTKEIANKLSRSEDTINTHRKNINAKLNLHSPVEISIFAIQNSLISLEKVVLSG